MVNAENKVRHTNAHHVMLCAVRIRGGMGSYARVISGHTDVLAQLPRVFLQLSSRKQHGADSHSVTLNEHVVTVLVVHRRRSKES